MSISALDSRVFRNLFGTQEMRDVFTDEAYVRRMIEVEAALARAQSKVGVIPPSAGHELTNAVCGVTIEYVSTHKMKKHSNTFIVWKGYLGILTLLAILSCR